MTVILELDLDDAERLASCLEHLNYVDPQVVTTEDDQFKAYLDLQIAKARRVRA